jgi:protein-tyrosine phosphatase
LIDLHAHILPGYDDGVRSIDEARALARAAAAEGVTAIAATPHVRADYPTTLERMLRGVELLRTDFAHEGIDVDVLTGGEVDLDRMQRLRADELRGFTLAGNGRWLLVEMPYRGWPAQLERRLEALRGQGLEAVLAHPERNADVQADPGRLAPLVAAGARVQITAASVDGRLGSKARACAQELVQAGCAHVLATDAHAPAVRAGGLAGAVAAIGDAGTARRLTVDNPRAIVAGSPVPQNSADSA